MPPCGLILYLHLDKTGGTWIRQTLRKCCLASCNRGAACTFTGDAWQSVEDPCLLRVLLETHWKPVVEERYRWLMERTVQCWTPPMSSTNAYDNLTNDSYVLPALNESRFFVEFHSHNWGHWAIIAPIIDALRSLYKRSRCSFTAFTVLREPRAQQLSHWNYFGRPRHHSLEEWAGLKADLSLKGVLGAGGAGPHWWRAHGEPIRDRNVTTRTSCAEMNLVHRAIDRLDRLDVVGLFERMDATLARVAALSGFSGFQPFNRGRSRAAHLPYDLAPLFRSGGNSSQRSPSGDTGTLRGIPSPVPSGMRPRSSHQLLQSSEAALKAVPPLALAVLTSAAACDALLHEHARINFLQNMRPSPLQRLELKVHSDSPRDPHDGQRVG